MQQTILPPTGNAIDYHITFESFKEIFLRAFKKNTGKEYDMTANNGEAGVLLDTVLYYIFSDSDNFLHSSLLSDLSVPSINKGLLIVGGYGIGKTSIFKILSLIEHAVTGPQRIQIFCKNIQGHDTSLDLSYIKGQLLRFKFFSANDVVERYESLEQNEKEEFWRWHSSGIKYYDDVMTEHVASNYGKIEVFKDIIEKRYNSGWRTMISTNYGVEENKHVGTARTLEMMGERYGPRVYDRLFEMFNIIELKGRSLRR